MQACIGIKLCHQHEPGEYRGPLFLGSTCFTKLRQIFEFELRKFQATVDLLGSLESSGEECSFRGTARLELMKSEIGQNTLSFSKDGSRNLCPNVSNYVLKLSSANNFQEPVVFMYFFDSGGGSYPEIISNAQVKWFQKKSEEINPDSRVPEIIFWHIPSKAYKKVAPNFNICKRCVGLIFLENVAPQEAEMGMMKVLKKRPSV